MQDKRYYSWVSIHTRSEYMLSSAVPPLISRDRNAATERVLAFFASLRTRIPIIQHILLCRTANDHSIDDVTFLPALGFEGVLFIEDLAQVGQTDVEGGRDLYSHYQTIASQSGLSIPWAGEK